MRSLASSSETAPITPLKAALVSAAFLLSACDTGPAPLSNVRESGTGAPASRAVQGVDGLQIGHRLMEAGEFELALEAYYAAGVELGLTPDVLSAIGSANLRLGRLGQAETILRRAIDDDERFVPAWNNLAVVLYQQGEIGEAREALKIAFALDSGQSTEIRDNLQLVEEKMASLAPEEPEPADFRLVRRGNGRYLLLGNN